MSDTQGIDAQERVARLADLEAAKQSAEMEGSHVPAEAGAVLHDYAEGRISEDEMDRQLSSTFDIPAGCCPHPGRLATTTRSGLGTWTRLYTGPRVSQATGEEE